MDHNRDDVFGSRVGFNLTPLRRKEPTSTVRMSKTPKRARGAPGLLLVSPKTTATIQSLGFSSQMSVASRLSK
ncbi:hypothetical protein D8S78_19370 [Natrialba swarupiae]|nr:hypothetical protein [Natrialba swarupiae]